jgi:prepilin-type N-terminal cleavage/methylation domain-containing protein
MIVGQGFGQRGFTLLEVLLSMAIVTALAGLSMPVLLSFNNRNDLDIATQGIVSSLRRAATYSRGVNQDSQWGVKVQTGSITLFKGTGYASRDAQYDETTSIPSNMATSGLDEIVFSKLEGTPNTNGNITLQSSPFNVTRTLTIKAKGMVDD